MDSGGWPAAWRERFADVLAAARAQAGREAAAGGWPVGVAQDRFARAIVAAATAGRGEPAAATLAAYRRDHARLWAAGSTPLDKATTRAHFDRLRSACRFVEADEIARLRQLAEAARKAKDADAMRAYTRQAFERAAVFRALFLNADRPTWAGKAAALREQGKRPASKSKRKAGRNAPSPDCLLVSLGNQRKRNPRVEVFAAVFAVFGIRPAELVRGVRIETTPDGLRLSVAGAKVGAVRGQPLRVLEVSRTRLGLSHLAVGVLTDAATRDGGRIQATAADIVAVRRAMGAAQPGLSPYAYRHARASDAKTTQGRDGVAAWLGHANDRTAQHYGHARSGRGAVVITGAKATRAIRRTKTLPPTLAERFARVAVCLMDRASAVPVRKPSVAPRKPRPFR
ncbi:MAG: hypothetical protein QM599_11665 [Pseudoxanthomonas sp.]